MTYSIAARIEKTNELGVSVSTGANPAVGSVVPHVEEGVGAIATQAHTNFMHGINGLKLLKMGFSPQNALELMLKEDPQRERRQVIVIDKMGRTAAHTGRDIEGEFKGHIIGKDYVVCGNILTRMKVIEDMASTYERTKGDLADRLLAVLEAGQAAGGDTAGRRTAAILVKRVPHYTSIRPFIDLRVDDSKDAVTELRRIYENYKIALKEMMKTDQKR